MATKSTVFQRALDDLLQEVLHGPTNDWAFILNPGDPGLLGQLETISADQASRLSPSGNSTIAAHVDHVWYGISLLNRWAAGEENPWEHADWQASWQRGQVNEQQWQALRAKLREQCEVWQRQVNARTQWDLTEACGALASLAHTAYHLGAIRQLVHYVAA